MAPFNRQQEKKKENPFKVEELILIFQLPMKRDHTLSPKWRGPFPIIKIENPFQVCYDDRGREKIAHVQHCKKFKTSMTLGKENYVTSCDDITSNDSWTPNGGSPIGGTAVRIQKEKEKGKNFKLHSLPAIVRCCSRISRSVFRGLSLPSRVLHLLQHGCSRLRGPLR